MSNLVAKARQNGTIPKRETFRVVQVNNSQEERRPARDMRDKANAVPWYQDLHFG